jgi:hypothetical protein
MAPARLSKILPLESINIVVGMLTTPNFLVTLPSSVHPAG